MTRKKQIHRGEILAAIIARSSQTVSEAAKQAGFGRSTYYLHVNNPNLPFHILEKYGKALGVDFSEYLPEMNSYKTYSTKKESLTREEAIKELDHWREKYFALLEKYHELSRDRLSHPKK